MKKPLTAALVAAVSIVSFAGAAAPDKEPASSSVMPEAPDRIRLGAEILARWSGRLEDGGDELRGALESLPTEALAAAARAESGGDLRAAVFGDPAPQLLGSPRADLVFTPLTPCRLADTRGYPGGPWPITPGSARAFDATVNLGAQGGNSAGCGVPSLEPPALAVTITAVNPQGTGNLRAYPARNLPPIASVVGYGLPGTGLNVANTTIVPLLQDLLIPEEFVIRADGSTVHVVIDVVGYFRAPGRAPLSCQTRGQVQLMAGTGFHSWDSPSCPEGTTLTGGGIDLPNFALADFHLLQSKPHNLGSRWSCLVINRGAEVWPVTCQAHCCSIPGAPLGAPVGGPGPAALGAPDSDLVYVPLVPCRLVDTRAVPSGPAPLVAGTARVFDASTALAAQGGVAAGCGVPSERAAALVLTMTAVDPEGPGSLRAYPAGAALPTASVLNYALPGSGIDMANTTILKMRRDQTSSSFTMRADGSTTHVLVDVVGYFAGPPPSPLVCETMVRQVVTPPGHTTTYSSPTCPFRTTLTGGGISTYVNGISFAEPLVDGLRSEPSGEGTAWTCTVKNPQSAARPSECYARCCQTPGIESIVIGPAFGPAR
jgi:hypothetical protein